MAFNVDDVETAVIQFYENPTAKAEVHAWLTQAQHSTQAWSFAFSLLHPAKASEVQFFAGNTIYIKVSRYWHEVPEEEYEALKGKLLEFVARFADSKIVVGRLLKAVAALVLNTMSSSWPTALEDLIATFSPENSSSVGLSSETSLGLLFSALMIIPEELENCQESYMSRQTRNTLRGLFISKAKQVLLLMQQAIQADQVSNSTREIVIKALASWLRLSLPFSETKDTLFALIPYCSSPQLIECVVECLQTAMEPEAQRYPNLTVEFIMQLLQLTSVLEEALTMEDENTASLIYSLYTSVAETYSSLLVKVALDDQGEKRAAVLQLISLLVQCSGAPGQYPTQETISNIPFAVWYSIQEDLLSYEGPEREQLDQIFQPVFLQLVDIFLQKSLLPPDEALSAEEKELFRCYRQDIWDSYMYTYGVLKNQMLQQLEQHMQHCVVRIQRSPDDWRPLEALLHAYASVAETVADSDSEYIPRFLESIPHIPFGDNVALITVALSTLGAYADWLNFHQEHLQHVIPLMMAGLSNELLVSAASQALRDLTLECPVTISPFAVSILDCCQRALSQFPGVEGAVKERIITIIARVLSVNVPQEVLINSLNTTITPILSDIAAIKDRIQAGGAVSRHDRSELVNKLKLLSCLARHLNSTPPTPEAQPETGTALIAAPPQQLSGILREQEQAIILQSQEQPLLLVLRQVLPLLDSLTNCVAELHDVVEVICKLLKNSVSTLLNDVESLLPVLLPTVRHLYCSSFHPATLDIIRLLAILFGSPGSFHLEEIATLVQGAVEVTLAHVSPELWTHTQLVHNLLTLSTCLIKKIPHILPTSLVHPLFILSMQCLGLPEDFTVRAATVFINQLLIQSREHSGGANEYIVRQNIELLLRTLISSFCASPRHNLACLSDILHSVCKLYRGQDLVTVFRKLEDDDSCIPSDISKDNRHKFVTSVLGAGTAKQTLLVVSDLVLLTRGVDTDFRVGYTASAASRRPAY